MNRPSEKLINKLCESPDGDALHDLHADAGGLVDSIDKRLKDAKKNSASTKLISLLEKSLRASIDLSTSLLHAANEADKV